MEDDRDRGLSFAGRLFMKIAITGSTGLIGSDLSSRLSTAGHDLIRLVRDPPAGHQLRALLVGDPQTGIKQREKLDGIEAVVHLAGRSIADHRWTKVEQLIRSSRIDATERLSHDLAALASPPRLFLSASAVGIYGDCQEQVVTERQVPGDDFLAKTAVDWEAASAELVTIGTQVLHTRFGVILTTRGPRTGQDAAAVSVALAATLATEDNIGVGSRWKIRSAPLSGLDRSRLRRPPIKQKPIT